MNQNLISPSDAYANCSQAMILDVRTDEEYDECHVSGSVLHTLDSLNPTAIQILRKNGEPCYVLCAAGKRAMKAAEILTAAGHENVLVIEGGIQNWIDKGLPVITLPEQLSLKHQSWIATGAVMILGAILGYLIHPAWYLLAGCGGILLIFSGITGWCPRMLLLSKLPWNKRTGRSSCRL